MLSFLYDLFAFLGIAFAASAFFLAIRKKD